ncbi:MAG: hypothetical protein ABI862_01865 [Ilumatobacteraceae bacterium]
MSEYDKNAVEDRLEGLIGRIRFHDVPANLHQRLSRLFVSSARRTHAPGIRVRIQALMRSDGFGGVALAGARGGGANRQLLFTAGDIDVTLQVSDGRTGDVNLDGMVLHADNSDRECAVRVEREGEVVAELATSEVGSFRVRDLSSGDYTLVIEMDDVDVVIGPVDLSR